MKIFHTSARTRNGFTIGLVTAVAALLISGVAQAVTNCTTNMIGGTVTGDLNVPAGASCGLDGVRVTGNVTVGTNANLHVTNSSGDTTIGGNIKGNGCDNIELQSPGTHHIVVGGDLTITNCTSVVFQGTQGNSSSAPPPTVLIGGNVKCDNNPGGCVFDYSVIAGNFECNGNFGCDMQSDAVGGNVTINNGGGGFILNTVVGGDVKCNGNSSPYGPGGNNTVAGSKTGQCSTI